MKNPNLACEVFLRNLVNLIFLNMDTPLILDIIERSHPKFKKDPYKYMEDDLEGEFSSVPHSVLHVEDIREYIHANIEELGGS